MSSLLSVFFSLMLTKLCSTHTYRKSHAHAHENSHAYIGTHLHPQAHAHTCNNTGTCTVAISTAAVLPFSFKFVENRDQVHSWSLNTVMMEIFKEDTCLFLGQDCEEIL